MSFIMNILQIKDVSLEQINAMKCNGFHYCIRALDVQLNTNRASLSMLLYISDRYKHVFILIIKVVRFLLLPYLHSHFIFSNLEPNQTRSCLHSGGRVCFLCMQNGMEGLLMRICDERFLPLHVK